MIPITPLFDEKYRCYKKKNISNPNFQSKIEICIARDTLEVSGHSRR